MKLLVTLEPDETGMLPAASLRDARGPKPWKTFARPSPGVSKHARLMACL